MPPVRTSPEAGGSEREGGVRKKMRKGTHSCFECRRRKIRCVFSPDNPKVCTECFARGSRCVDQEHADSDVIVDQRKNLRERVARLEALVDSLMDEKSDRKAAEVLRNLGSEDRFPPTPHTEDTPASVEQDGPTAHAPFLTLFSNDVLARPKQTSTRSPSACSQQVPTPDGTSPLPTYKLTCNMAPPSVAAEEFPKEPSPAKIKMNRTRQALLSALPSYDKLIPILKRNEVWWILFGRKCPGTRGRSTLEEFAQRVITKGTVCELGTLVLCYGMNSDGDIIDQCLAAVDRYVISDDEYMGTLEGLECCIFQCKIYADLGQARRAWLTCRRALGFAELMGLHRNHSASPERDSIWWTLYGADRLTSLMLGMPYAISDSHVVMELGGKRLDQNTSREAFIARVAVFAGKVIDRTQGIQESSYATMMDLDHELNTYAAALGEDWWDVQPMTADDVPTEKMIDWQEKLLSNLCFHQTRVYLHMPFMLKSTTNRGYDYSRNTCFEAAREMLRLYHILRNPLTPIYECKAVDFIGFTAAVIVVLGLLGYGRLSQHHDSNQDESDWQLIETSMEIFKEASKERGGKVAEQSYRALEQLSLVRNIDCIGPDTDPECYAKIAIPFFGTISVQRGKSFKHVATHSANSSSRNTPGSSASNGPPTPNTSTSNTSDANAKSASTLQQQQNNTSSTGNNGGYMNPLIAYDGFYLPPVSFENQQQQPDFSNDNTASSLATNWPVANGFLWENVGNMDIDQDWSWFTNDASFQNVSAGFGHSF